MNHDAIRIDFTRRPEEFAAEARSGKRVLTAVFAIPALVVIWGVIAVVHKSPGGATSALAVFMLLAAWLGRPLLWTLLSNARLRRNARAASPKGTMPYRDPSSDAGVQRCTFDGLGFDQQFGGALIPAGTGGRACTTSRSNRTS